MVTLINPHLSNGLSHHYHLDESTFNFRGIRSFFVFFFFHFYFTFIEIPVSKQCRPRDAAFCGVSFGSTMVLGSFQCRGVLLLWHMVGQGPAVLAAGAERVGCFFFFFCLFFISSILSSFSNASSVARRLDILKYCGLGRYNPAVVVSYYRRRAC